MLFDVIRHARPYIAHPGPLDINDLMMVRDALLLLNPHGGFVTCQLELRLVQNRHAPSQSPVIDCAEWTHTKPPIKATDPPHGSNASSPPTLGELSPSLPGSSGPIAELVGLQAITKLHGKGVCFMRFTFLDEEFRTWSTHDREMCKQRFQQQKLSFCKPQNPAGSVSQTRGAAFPLCPAGRIRHNR